MRLGGLFEVKVRMGEHACALYVAGNLGRLGYSFRFAPAHQGFQVDWVSGPWATLGPIVQFHVFDEAEA